MCSKVFQLGICFVFSIAIYSQECKVTLSGIVTDTSNDNPLPDVSIFVEETKDRLLTDFDGKFEFSSLCEGEYHLTISHFDCYTQRIHLHLQQDTIVSIQMSHSVDELHSLVIIGSHIRTSTEHADLINEQYITDNAHKNLSNLLENIPGVRSLRNGNTVSKPIIDGLYGNRITILNNGISQSGQQWGNDHSPEIDPLSAQNIKVVKGSAALEYMGSPLGGVVLVEPGAISQEKHLHGRANYHFQSNGRGHGLNLQLHKYAPSFAWKVNTTAKKSGDLRAADYFLTNTGSQELNASLQLEKKISDTWKSQLYVSTFNTELGILRGSHIGNTTDLEEALTREVPFFTEDNFSYDINAPRQEVSHHFIKLHSLVEFDDTQELETNIAFQYNDRKEYDVRRNNRSDIPALSLQQYSFFVENKFRKEMKNNYFLNSGIQYNYIDNNNNPETGILPLVPDYFSYQTGVFGILTKKINQDLVELGIRYDNLIQKVATISNELEIVRFDNTFHNFSTSLGYRKPFRKEFTLSANIGYAMRNPAINELYSNGLHQGVSGIEEGSPNLDAEESLKSTLTLEGSIGKSFSYSAMLYYQNIQDYIFLEPQEELRLTIRGAFPVFIYKQTHAEIMGVDISIKENWTPWLQTKMAIGIVTGKDKTRDLPLVNIPTNNIRTTTKYLAPKSIAVGNINITNFEIGITHTYVSQAPDDIAQIDFIPPPSDYHLLGMSSSADFQLGKTRLRANILIDNITNTSYRDYLNRLRYFADDMGINAQFGITLLF